jgi:hypothetical protein
MISNLIKEKVIQINQLTEGNVIFVGSLSWIFNDIDKNVRDIDIIIPNKNYLSQFTIFGDIKPSKFPDLFGKDVERCYIISDNITIDIFIHTKSYETKEIKFKGEILKTTTIKGCLKHYDEWLPILKSQIIPEDNQIMIDYYNKMQSKANELLKYL